MASDVPSYFAGSQMLTVPLHVRQVQFRGDIVLWGCGCFRELVGGACSECPTAEPSNPAGPDGLNPTRNPILRKQHQWGRPKVPLVAAVATQ